MSRKKRFKKIINIKKESKNQIIEIDFETGNIINYTEKDITQIV